MSGFGLQLCGSVLGPGSEKLGWCYVCMSCKCGFFVYMAGPDICILR